MSSVSTYPSTQHPRAIASPSRVHTEPGPRGFLGSVMGHRGFDKGVMMVMNELEKKATQEEQDIEDEKARKRAMANLVNSWQERLQLISVITTFFVSTEAALLVNAKPDSDADANDGAMMATNACLLGSLLLHVWAAVLSFLGAFLLTQYKLKEATREEIIAEGTKWIKSLHARSTGHDIERDATDPTALTSTNVTHVERDSADNGTAKLRRFNVSSSHLLKRTHALCVCLASLGFLLAIAGILCYAWQSQPLPVSIFASACLGGGVLAMAIMLV